MKHLAGWTALLALLAACGPQPAPPPIASGFYLATSDGVVHYGYDGERTDLGLCAYDWPLLAVANGLLYCTGRASLSDPLPELYVYDGRGAQAFRIPVPPQVRDWFVAFLPLASGLIAYGDNADDRVYLADPNGKLRKSLKLRDAADTSFQNAYLLEHDGRLYASEDGDQRVLSWDLETFERQVEFDLGGLGLSWIGSLARDPGSGDLFVSAMPGNRIYRLPSGGPPALFVSLPGYAPILGFAGGTLYAGGYGDTIYAVDPATAAVAPVVTGVPSARGFAVVP